MIEEIKELRDKLDELERKYHFVNDYKLVCTILDKLYIDKMELLIDEVESNNSLYMVQRDIENGNITITKENRE